MLFIEGLGPPDYFFKNSACGGLLCKAVSSFHGSQIDIGESRSVTFCLEEALGVPEAS